MKKLIKLSIAFTFGLLFCQYGALSKNSLEEPEDIPEHQEPPDIEEQADAKSSWPNFVLMTRYDYSKGLDQRMLGGGLGFIDVNNLWLISADIGVTWPRKRGRVQRSDDFYYQFWERRFLIQLKVSKFFFLPNENELSNRLGLYGEFGGTYGFGHYRATNVWPDDFTSFAGGLGIVWKNNDDSGIVNFLLKFGYHRNQIRPHFSHHNRYKFSLVITQTD